MLDVVPGAYNLSSWRQRQDDHKFKARLRRTVKSCLKKTKQGWGDGSVVKSVLAAQPANLSSDPSPHRKSNMAITCLLPGWCGAAGRKNTGAHLLPAWLQFVTEQGCNIFLWSCTHVCGHIHLNTHVQHIHTHTLIPHSNIYKQTYIFKLNRKEVHFFLSFPQ